MKPFVALFHLQPHPEKQVLLPARKEIQKQGERAMNLQEEPGPSQHPDADKSRKL